MTSTDTRPTFAATALQQRIRPLRRVDNWTNLAFLAWEYACIAGVVFLCVAFGGRREAWGLSWWWNLPVFALAIGLIGALQHRLAGLGHEASHYAFMKNRFLNDLIPDLFCMFPILTNIHFYRLFHMAHHQYTNDHELDPDLVNMGRSKMVDRFPMARARIVLMLYLRAFVSPLSFARYQWDYVYVNTLGKGGNVYMKRVPGGDAESRRPRTGTLLGIAYLLTLHLTLLFLTATGREELVVPATLLGLAIALLGMAWIPARLLFQSPFRQAYSPRLAGAFRLVYFTALLAVLAWLRVVTGGQSSIYVFFLWLLPMGTTFMTYMLIRDVFQHANADDGRLTNSRVFFTDPFTRWAVFVYGQDMHVPHHLFPAIPHYRLPALHRLLREGHAEYASKVVECHGTFQATQSGAPSIFDELSDTTRLAAG
jgi:fatty acid desaturase